MTARPSTITTIAIAWASLWAQSLGAQERPAAQPDRATILLLRDAEAARLKMLERAEDSRRLVRPIPEAEKEVLKLQAIQTVLQERAEQLQRVQRNADARFQRELDDQYERLVDLMFARVEALHADDPALQEPDARARGAIERMVYSMAFGGTDAGRARDTFNRHLETDLAMRRRSIGLTPAQESKLRLAAAGDMKRFFDNVGAVREQFLAAANDPATKKKLVGELRRFRQISRAGPFGEGSLYDKVLNRIRRERDAAEH